MSTTWFPQKVVLWTESPLEIWLWRFRSKQAIVRPKINDLDTNDLVPNIKLTVEMNISQIALLDI